MARHKNTIEVLVKSRKVASEVVEVPYFSGVHHYLGPTTTLRSRKVVYRHQLDEEQERLVQSGKELADIQGFELRVHDLSRDSILLRFLRFVFMGGAFTPALVIRAPMPPHIAITRSFPRLGQEELIGPSST